MEEWAYSAYYSLTNYRKQIEAYVFDVVRSVIPQLEIDEVFASKIDMGKHIHKELDEVLNEFGYKIMYSLVTDLSPDPLTKASMNEIKHVSFSF